MSNTTEISFSLKKWYYVIRTIQLFILIVMLIAPFIGSLIVFKCTSSTADKTDETSSIVLDYNSLNENSTERIDPKKLEIRRTKIPYKGSFVFCFLIYEAAFVALFIFFIKDDSGIRYAKLDALNSIKEKLLSDDFTDSTDETTEIDPENSNKTITTKTCNRADLFKHYMDCVTEI